MTETDSTPPWKELTALADRLHDDARRIRANPLDDSGVLALLDAKKAEVRAAAVSAIQSLITDFKATIGGRLRGLPRLSRVGNPGFRGIRLRTKHHDEQLRRPPRGGGWGDPALCIDERGSLVLVREHDDGDLSITQVDAEDLHAEDLSTVISGVLYGAERASRHAQECSETLDGIRVLAEDLSAFMQEDP